MNGLLDFMKAAVRPMTLAIFYPMIAIMTWEGRFNEIPIVILALVGLGTGEYWVERAIKRLKKGGN